MAKQITVGSVTRDSVRDFLLPIAPRSSLIYVGTELIKRANSGKTSQLPATAEILHSKLRVSERVSETVKTLQANGPPLRLQGVPDEMVPLIAVIYMRAKAAL